MELITFGELDGFEWDIGNSSKSSVKHDVSMTETEEIFFNSPLLLAGDDRHSLTERRILALGVTNTGRKLSIVFTVRARRIRVITARDMSRKERRAYEKES